MAQDEEGTPVKKRTSTSLITPPRKRSREERGLVTPQNLLTKFDDVAMPGRSCQILPKEIAQNWGECFRCKQTGHFKNDCPFDTRIFEAKLETECKGCHVRIKLGERIVRSDLWGGFGHARCHLGQLAENQNKEHPPSKRKQLDQQDDGIVEQIIKTTLKGKEKENYLVLACAGAGKTRMLTKLYNEIETKMKESVHVLVYNKDAQQELSKKRGVKNATTFHALSSRAFTAFLNEKKLQVYSGKTKRIINHLYPQCNYNMVKMIASLVSLAKSHCYGIRQSYEEDVTLLQLVEKFDLCKRYSVHNQAIKSQACDIAHHVLEVSKNCALPQRQLSDGKSSWPFGPILHKTKNKLIKLPVVDFDDQIFMALAVNAQLFTKKLKYLLVDECQDTNTARRFLLCRILEQNPQAKLVAVGDPLQAIYGFAGANADAFDRVPFSTVKERFFLSINYRCPSSHIDLANSIPKQIDIKSFDYQAQMQARPNAIRGKIIYGATLLSHPLRGDQLANNPATAKPDETTAILCRTNAPLLALRGILLARGILSDMLGRDSLKNKLLQFLNQFEAHSLDEFEEALESYMRRNSMLGVENDDIPQESARDMVSCFKVILKLLKESEDPKTLEQFKMKMLQLLSDDDTKGIPPDKRKKIITLATGHKAKGLEFSVVYLLEPHLLPLQWVLDKGGWQARQELNLQYVCYTRSTNKLIFLRDCTKNDSRPNSWRDKLRQGLFPDPTSTPSFSIPRPESEAEEEEEEDYDPAHFWRKHARRQRGEDEPSQDESATRNTDDDTVTSLRMACAELRIDLINTHLTKSEVRKKYKLRLLDVHPDKQAQKSPDTQLSEEESNAATRRAKTAYDYLEGYLEKQASNIDQDDDDDNENAPFAN